MELNTASSNGLQGQAITWTDVDFKSIGALGTNFNDFLFSFMKMHLKVTSVAW